MVSDALVHGSSHIHVFADDDEIEWVSSLTADVATGITWNQQENTIVPGGAAKTEIGEKYFRALAKIGFHYLLATNRSLVGLEPEFSAVRKFIRHGGSPDPFFKEEEAVIVQRESTLEAPDRPIQS
jgi:hypothetical protein